jgi:hypothetical protein
MRTAAGVLFIVLAIWVALEIFTKGTRGAFGGALVTYLPASATAGEPEAAPLDRIRRNVFGARDEREERTYRAASDPSNEATE